MPLSAALSPLSRILSKKRLHAPATGYSTRRLGTNSRTVALMPTSSLDEVVDDSEPEREELRRREKPSRNYIMASTVVKRLRNPIDIIEITDDESDTAAGLPSVIEIPDAAAKYILPQPAEKTLHNSRILVSGKILSRSPPISSTSLIIPGISEDPHSEDDDDAKINFARFAYAGSTSSLKPLANEPGLSRESPSVNSTTASKPPPKRKPAHRFADDFSDGDLSKLSKCVGCEVHWTARKTPAQKMLHVQACAKKKSLSDATVRILIRREIDSAVATVAQLKSKGKGKADKAIPDPKTFLEDVVAQAAPRKKGRRLDTKETVQSVTQTRDLILGRARAVIGTPFSVTEDQNFSVGTQAVRSRRPSLGSSMLPSTQAFGVSSLAQKHFAATTLLGSGPQLTDKEINDAEMPATQAFARSKLGLAPRPLHLSNEDSDAELPATQAFTHSKLAIAHRPFHIDGEESDAEVPPATQPFASSKLGGSRLFDSFSRAPAPGYHQLAVLSSPFPSYNEKTDGQSAAPANCILDSFRAASAVSLLDLSSRETSHRAPRASSSVLERPDAPLPKDYSIPEDGDDDAGRLHYSEWEDDACLHFDPEENLLPVISSTPPRSVYKTAKITPPRSRGRKGSPKKTMAVTPILTEATPTSRKTPGRRKLAVQDEPDDIWDAKMKAKITCDTNLHLRILRYEPIHFDVFLQLANEDLPYSGKPPSGKLRGRLSKFLDRQAIHFYAEPGRRR